MGDWFAVQVWTGREHAAATHLRTRGYEVFLPCYRERRRWTDRVKVIERALFGGYVFCRLAREVLGLIVTVPGVIRIVGDGRGPIALPAEEVAAIQRVVETRAAAEPFDGIRVGDRVRMEFGPLHGIEGIVVSARNLSRLVLSIGLLQRSIAVEIDPTWVVRSGS
jgi:transcription antitermination factor NusG